MKKIMMAAMLGTASIFAMDQLSEDQKKFIKFDNVILNYPEEAIELISEMNVNYANPDHLGQTPLHLACIFNQPDVARALLVAAANINENDGLDKTPLDYALGFQVMPNGDMGLGYVSDSDAEPEEFSGEEHAHPQLVRLLVEYGVAITPENRIKIKRLLPDIID